MPNFIYTNLAMQGIIGIFILNSCKGRPWSPWFGFFGLVYIAHGVFSFEQLDFPVFWVEFNENIGKATSQDVKQVKKISEFWKIVIPVISWSIGCSMIATFFASSKPKEI